LARAIEARDSYTEGHVERVAEYSVALGKRIGMHDKELRILEQGAIMHDVGKIGIPDQILNKPGKLSSEEYETMKSHTWVGEQICSSLKSLKPILDIVRHHQEHVNGSGYPDGLRGEEMGLGARIVAIADAYDAMTTDRPYRKSLGHEEACKRLGEGSGSQWDSNLIDAFLAMLIEDPSLGASDE